MFGAIEQFNFPALKGPEAYSVCPFTKLGFQSKQAIINIVAIKIMNCSTVVESSLHEA